MTPTPEQLAAVTEPIRRRYLEAPDDRERERWGRAVVHHAAQASVAEPPLPSVWKMAGELVMTGIAVAASGFEKAPEDLQARRWAACEACVEHFRPSDRRCGAESGCGCVLESKIPWAAAACPVGKW